MAGEREIILAKDDEETSGQANTCTGLLWSQDKQELRSVSAVSVLLCQKSILHKI